MFAVTFHTSEYRGDHAADVTIAIECDSWETLDEIANRAGLERLEDHIEIRVIKRQTDIGE